MKKLMLILALGTFGLTSVQAAPNLLSVNVEQPYQDDKIEIDEADLPQAIKDAILNDSELEDLEIDKVYQVTKDNQLFYKVKFDGGAFGEDVTKKYDATGKEIQHDDHDPLEKEPVRL